MQLNLILPPGPVLRAPVMHQVKVCSYVGRGRCLPGHHKNSLPLPHTMILRVKIDLLRPILDQNQPENSSKSSIGSPESLKRPRIVKKKTFLLTHDHFLGSNDDFFAQMSIVGGTKNQIMAMNDDL